MIWIISTNDVQEQRWGRVVMGKISGERLNGAGGMWVDLWRMEATEISRGCGRSLRQGRSKKHSGLQNQNEGLMDEEIRTELKVRRQVRAHLPTASKERPRLRACCLTLLEALRLGVTQAWECIFQLGGWAAPGPRTGISLVACVKNSVRNYSKSTALNFPLNNSHNKLHVALQERWYSSHFTGEETESQRGLNHRPETTW